ncbi:MAG: hypothetical protein JWL62_1946, partial [Hyphomicrobiales bacterium]|nr:hypothetical protein [Hyphomicrobiales bacterium]
MRGYILCPERQKPLIRLRCRHL